MKLAIVIPYYKITFFEETIASLANQTNKNFKVYIGNDASPECPEALIEQYKDKFNFIYKKFETNLGSTSLVKQWERCIDTDWGVGIISKKINLGNPSSTVNPFYEFNVLNSNKKENLNLKSFEEFKELILKNDKLIE
tara:strand:+ start:1600 stop:2013 length:414 start_codon:yes stop_codon:yes gene_type:complete